MKRPKSKLYRTFRYLLLSAAAVYILLLCYPQVLFAHQISYKNFTVYSREPLDQNIYALLDKVEISLAKSPINDPQLKPNLFLTNSHAFYSALTLTIGGNSYAKGLPLLPTNNIFINRTDAQNDLVFRRATTRNSRSLSGVMTHEVTHLLVREKFGYIKNLMTPTWKREGYAEYVAGGSALDNETGVKLWKANPQDDTAYQYFKYYMMVKYLLDTEKLSVEELFSRDFDRSELEAKVLSTL